MKRLSSAIRYCGENEATKTDELTFLAHLQKGRILAQRLQSVEAQNVAVVVDSAIAEYQKAIISLSGIRSQLSGNRSRLILGLQMGYDISGSCGIDC